MIRIAFRNLFRQRRRSLLTMLTMMGGFVLAAFSIAWADGTYNSVIEAFTRNRLGHIQIHSGDYLDQPSLYKSIGNVAAVGEQLDRVDGVVHWTPRIFAFGLGSVGDRSTAVRLIGIDPAREDAATSFSSKIISGQTLGNTPDHGMVLGQGLARQLHAVPGSELVIVSQAADGSIANDLYTVTGILDSGDPMADRMDGYLHLGDVQELMVMGGRVHEIAIIVDALKHVEKMAASIRVAVDDETLRVESWRQFAASFYRAMQADKQGNWITLVVILLIVAVGVLNTVLMSVLERRREYGVLLALGTRGGRLVRMVLGEILTLAAGSVLIGSVIAFVLNWWISIRGVRLSEPFTYGGITFEVLRTELNPQSFLIPAVTVLITALVVALLPAMMAVRTDPARSMRMH